METVKWETTVGKNGNRKYAREIVENKLVKLSLVSRRTYSKQYPTLNVTKNKVYWNLP